MSHSKISMLKLIMLHNIQKELEEIIVQNTFISVFISLYFNISFMLSVNLLNINEYKEDIINFEQIADVLLHNRGRSVF